MSQKVFTLQARRPELGVQIRKSSLVGWYTLTFSALGSVGRNTQILGAQAASLTDLVSSRLSRVYKDVLWHPCVHAHTQICAQEMWVVNIPDYIILHASISTF